MEERGASLLEPHGGQVEPLWLSLQWGLVFVSIK